MGGAEKLLIQLMEHLDPHLFDIHLLCFNNQGCLFKNIPETVIKICVTRNLWQIFRYFKQEHFDIVHTHLIKADMVGLLLGWLTGVPVLFTTRHNVRYFTGIKKIFKGLDAWLLQKTKKVIAISKAVRDYYVNQPEYRQVPFEVIHNGVFLEPFLNLSLKKPSVPLQLLTVGSLTRQKGHLEFLSILKEIPKDSYEWHLVGTGAMEKDLKQRVKEDGLEACIHFHGVQECPRSFYESADLFILPSLWEGFGLVLVEAMAAGIPVFASAVDGVPEIVAHDLNGFLFSWCDPDAALEQLNYIFSKPEILVSRGIKARKDAAKFSIQNMAEDYRAIYSTFSKSPDL